MCVDPGGWALIFETPAIISGAANRHTTLPSPGISCACSSVIAVRVESGDDTSVAAVADAAGQRLKASGTVRQLVSLTDLPYKLGRVAPSADQRRGIVYAAVVGNGDRISAEGDVEELVALRVARECCIDLNKPTR
jgi:hypothetical protein